jgi:hypothetical protein
MKYIKLFERKNVGELYHVLDYSKLLFVLDNNMIKSYKAGGGRISTSRSKMFNSYLGSSPQAIFKLVLDGDKLSSKFKIKPFRYFSKNGRGFEEFEEQIATSVIKDVFKYIKSVVLIRKNVEDLMTNPWDDDISDYLTSIGASNGTLPEMIKIIKNRLDKLGINFLVQNKTVIEKDDKFIDFIINHPIKEVRTKKIVMYRGKLSKERQFSYDDSLVDLSGKVVTRDLVIGNSVIDINKFDYKEINDDNIEDIKNEIKDKETELSEEPLEPYVFNIREETDGVWELSDFRPLKWL